MNTFLRVTPPRKNEAVMAEADHAAMKARMNARVAALCEASRPSPHKGLRGHVRDEQRKPVYRVGTAMFDQVSTHSCRVADQSYSGLRIVLNADVDCPDEFALTIPTLRFVGIVKKRWQHGRQAGVSIVRWNDAA